MEKKTMGSLIAALRKANGMTQKELAERLNVSDKTVSRWECDDGAPDIATIPVIAEIFGVSCDELLRGERRSPDQLDIQEPSPKAEKQRKRLFALSLTKLNNMSWIAIGVALCGLLGAMIANFGFLRANIGFFVCTAFCLGSIVIQCIGLNNAFLAVADEELDRDEVGQFKHAVIKRAEWTFGIVTVLIGATFPLVLVDAYLGLGTDSVLLLGLIFGGIACVIYAIVLFFVNALLIKKGVYTQSEKESAIYRQNHSLKKKFTLVFILILLVTICAHVIISEIRFPYAIMKGTTFDDIDSLNVFYEAEVNKYNDITGGDWIETVKTVIDHEDGTMTCEYHNPYDIGIIKIDYLNGDNLPITVYTYDDLHKAEHRVLLRNTAFAAAYVIEILTGLIVYFKKRAK